MRFIVDTHTLIWWIEKNSRLSATADAILTSPTSQLIIPVIVLCEFYYYLKKTKQTEAYPTVYRKLEQDTRMTLEPLAADLVAAIPDGLEMHDGLIAALCLASEGSVILSQDLSLRQWGGRRVVWE